MEVRNIKLVFQFI